MTSRLAVPTLFALKPSICASRITSVVPTTSTSPISNTVPLGMVMLMVVIG